MKHVKFLGRKVISLLLVVAIMFSFSTQIYAKDVAVKLDGIAQKVKVAPKFSNGSLVLDGAELAKIVGAKLTINKENGTATFTNSAKTVVFTNGVLPFTIDGKLKNSAINAVVSEYSASLPIRTVCEAFGFKVSYDAKNLEVLIKSNVKGLEVLPTIAVKNPEAKVVTYEVAVKDAIAKNSTLKSLIENLDYLEKVSKDTVDSEYDMTTNLATGQFNETGYVSWIRSLDQYSSQENDVPLTSQILRETAEYTLRNTVATIKGYELDIALLKQNIAQSETSVNNLTLKNTVGMASDVALKSAKQDLDKMKASLVSLDLNLFNQRLALNKFLGYKPTDIVEITFVPQIVDFTFNSEAQIMGKVLSDPKTKQKEEALRMSQFNYDTAITSDDNYETTKVKLQNDINTKGRDLVDTKEALEKSIRSGYINIQLLQKSKESLNIDLQKAKDSYATAAANLEAGNITVSDLNAAKLGILKVEIDLLKNVYSYDNLKFAFDRPFLLS